MRTNIVVDDTIMEEALKLSGVKTKKSVVDKALKLLVQVKRQEAIRELKGKLPGRRKYSIKCFSKFRYLQET